MLKTFPGLHLAVLGNCPAVVQILISVADIQVCCGRSLAHQDLGPSLQLNQTDMFGYTALMCAATLPRGLGADVAKILLQRREVLLISSQTFLLYSSPIVHQADIHNKHDEQHGDIDHQLDLDWRDSEGRGAEEIARISGSSRVVALIRFTIVMVVMMMMVMVMVIMMVMVLVMV